EDRIEDAGREEDEHQQLHFTDPPSSSWGAWGGSGWAAADGPGAAACGALARWPGPPRRPSGWAAAVEEEASAGPMRAVAAAASGPWPWARGAKQSNRALLA